MTQQAPEFWLSLMPDPSGVDRGSPAYRRHKECQHVLAVLRETHPELYRCQEGAALSAEQARALVEKLKKQRPGHVFKHSVSYLIRGLEAGVQAYNWDVVIPEAPVVIPRHKPRLDRDRFSTFAKATPSLYEAFLRDVTGPPPESRTRQVGQILCSAILFGGLVQRRWTRPLVEALEQFRSDGAACWVDLRLTRKQVERDTRPNRERRRDDPAKAALGRKKTVASRPVAWEIRRRWFPDPLTRVLLTNWNQTSSARREGLRDTSPHHALDSYLEYLRRQAPESVVPRANELRQLGGTRLALGVPPFLQAFAEGHVKSVPVPAHTWHRLLTGRILPAPDISSRPAAPPPLRSLASHTPARPLSPGGQERLFSKLTGALNPPERVYKQTHRRALEVIQHFQSEHRDELCPTAFYLTLWAKNLLTHHSLDKLSWRRTKSRLRPSTVKTYLHTIAKRLIAEAEDVDLLGLEENDFHDLYGRVIQTCLGTELKHRVGHRLAGFHEFLILRGGAPTVDFSDLFVDGPSPETSVDANLLSPTDFDHLKRVLCPKFEAASPHRKIQYLVAVLGFRCGLRRNEARNLRIKDIQGATRPEALVRPSRFANTKTRSSTRRIPLFALLEPDELGYLLSWRNQRLTTNDMPEAALFSGSIASIAPLTEDEIFPAIETAMRQVTGDPAVRFHHLRHSFATWTLLRLLRDFSTAERSGFAFLRHPAFDPAACDELRRNLLGNMTLGRQAPYAVAQLCGHASPQVTLLHYFHLCDWLLGLELSRAENEPALTAEAVATLTGLKQGVVYYALRKTGRKRKTVGSVVDRLPPLGPLDTGGYVQPNLSPLPDSPPPPRTNRDPIWRDILKILHLRQQRGMSFEDLAEHFGFEADGIRRWCTNTEELRQVTHRMRGGSRDGGEQDRPDGPTSPFPRSPGRGQSGATANRIIKTVDAFDRERREQVLPWVEHFIRHATSRSHGIHFSNAGRLEAYRWFLTEIGVPLEQIRVRHILPRGSATPVGQARATLAADLALPLDAVTVNTLSAHSNSKNGRFFVRVTHPPKEKTRPPLRCYGFTFAMYFIAIRYDRVPRTESMGGLRRSYSAELKKTAIRRLTGAGEPISAVARDMNIPARTLYRWKREEREAEDAEGPADRQVPPELTGG